MTVDEGDWKGERSGKGEERKKEREVKHSSNEGECCHHYDFGRLFFLHSYL